MAFASALFSVVKIVGGVIKASELNTKKKEDIKELKKNLTEVLDKIKVIRENVVKESGQLKLLIDLRNDAQEFKEAFQEYLYIINENHNYLKDRTDYARAGNFLELAIEHFSDACENIEAMQALFSNHPKYFKPDDKVALLKLKVEQEIALNSLKKHHNDKNGSTWALINDHIENNIFPLRLTKLLDKMMKVLLFNFFE